MFEHGNGGLDGIAGTKGNVLKGREKGGYPSSIWVGVDVGGGGLIVCGDRTREETL